MDTKFSTAIHSLILIANSEKILTSEQIAQSVGTQSSYIRKVLGLLKKEGILTSHQGSGGFSLSIKPEDLTLQRIYNSLNKKRFFDIHQNPNDECIVGRHIKSTLSYVLNNIEEAIQHELKSQTLADCINHIKGDLSSEELLML